MTVSLRDEYGPGFSHELSTGLRCESPFHVPDVGGAMVFGTLRWDACDEAMAGSRYVPVRCSNGRALGCLWFSVFGSSTCGPYQELTVTFLVQEREKTLTVPWVNRWTPFAVQEHPEVFVCEYTLLLNNRHAIAYGRELHGFDKHMGELGCEDRGNVFRFRVSEDTVLSVLGSLRVRTDLRLQGRMLLEVTKALGVWKTGRALAEAVHRLRVVTPPTVFEARSDLYFRGRPVLLPWEGYGVMTFGMSRVGGLLQKLDFVPTAAHILRDGEGVMPYTDRNTRAIPVSTEPFRK